MKEDILEQLVDEYLQHKGYFTTHNVKFRPNKSHADYNSKQDSVHSDIDVLAYNPTLEGPERVLVVNCKSWQNGLNIKSKLSEFEQNKIVSGREAWRGFRELLNPKWSEAFREKVYEASGSRVFTHVTFKRSNYNQVLVNALVRSYQWNQLLESGKVSITDLAKREGRNRTHISRIVNLMYLAPEIIASILTGRQPETLHLKDLTKSLPIKWEDQRFLLLRK